MPSPNSKPWSYAQKRHSNGSLVLQQTLTIFFQGRAHTSPKRRPCLKVNTLACWMEIPLSGAFVSPVMIFRGLTHLVLRLPCFSPGGCAFHLTDEDIAEIATALPYLRDVIFGLTCSTNSCQTTVSSLLFFPTRCISLKRLETRFNTTNLRCDLKLMVEIPRFHDLYALPKCQLERLSVSVYYLLPSQRGMREGQWELKGVGLPVMQ